MLWFALGSADLQNGPTALSRISGQNASANTSSTLREGALVESITETFTSPLGRMYQPTTDQSLGGTTSAYARVTNSENQIGDFGLKAGPIAVLALALAFGNILLRARRALARADDSAPELEGLWIAAIATLIGAALTQLVLAEAYTGVMLWFAFGILHQRAVDAEAASQTTSPARGRADRLSSRRTAATRLRREPASMLSAKRPGIPGSRTVLSFATTVHSSPTAVISMPRATRPRERHLSYAAVRRLALRGDGAVLSSLLQQGALFISGIGSAWLIGNMGRGELAYGTTISSVAGIFAIGGWAPAATLGVAGQWGQSDRVLGLLRQSSYGARSCRCSLLGLGWSRSSEN